MKALVGADGSIARVEVVNGRSAGAGRRLARLAGVAVCACLGACATATAPVATDLRQGDCTPPQNAAANGYWLCAVGSRYAMLRNGDLSARIALADLPDDRNLVAVGPVEGLKGEVTVYGGVAYVSTVENGRDVVRRTTDVSAIFLAYGSTPAWREIRTTSALDGFDAIEAFVAGNATAIGLDPDTAFPFRFEGTASRLRYHVIYRTEDGTHDHAAHRRAKIPFRVDGERIAVAGVWADPQSVGRYTHPVIDGGRGSGHVDDIRIDAGATLFLPDVR